MNWYLIVKFFHVLAVTIMVGGMFARQLVRGVARRNDDVNTILMLTHVAIRIDRAMVIPGSNLLLVAGVFLALLARWPLFGFLQGAAQNWLLVSNILLILTLVLIPTVFVPHNKKVETLLQAALAEGRLTPELTTALNDRRNALAHHAEEIIVVLITLLMVLKPF